VFLLRCVSTCTVRDLYRSMHENRETRTNINTARGIYAMRGPHAR
jgi:hypothetical protein